MKKIFYAFLTLLLVGMIAGCSLETKESEEPAKEPEDHVIEIDDEEKTRDVIPDPEEILPDARLVIFDSEPNVFYQVKDFQDGDYEIYKEACKEVGFTDVQYQGGTDTTNMYWAYDEDHEYYLELGINHENQIIDIICSKVETDSGDAEETN